MNLSKQLDDDETMFHAPVKRDSTFFLFWETLYALVFVINALCIPYWVATRNISFMSDLQEH